MPFKAQRLAKDFFVAQPLAAECFINREAGDDGRAAAAQAARQRNLARDRQSRAADRAPAMLGHRAGDAGNQVRFAALDRGRAFPRRIDYKFFRRRFDGDAQVERQRQPDRVEACAQV